MEGLNQVKVKHKIFDDAVYLTLGHGTSIDEILDLAEIPVEIRDKVVVLNHGSIVGDWEYITKEADQIAICVVPQGGGGGGGKQILSVVAMIAIAAVAWYAAPLILGAGASQFAIAAVAAGITMVGSLALNALIKPPALGINGSARIDNRPGNVRDAQEQATFRFGGQSNQARKYQPAIKVYGRHKLFPALAANPLIENAGTQAFLASIYDFGIGNVLIEDLRIGDVDVQMYEPKLVFHHNSYCNNLQMYPKRVSYDTLTYVLKRDNQFIVRTKPESITGQVDIFFPRGLVYYDAQGNRKTNKVQLEVFWQDVNAPSWRKVQESQFFGAEVKNDKVVVARTEIYDRGSDTQTERYSLAAPKSYWKTEVYSDPNQGGNDNSFWGGDFDHDYNLDNTQWGGNEGRGPNPDENGWWGNNISDSVSVMWEGRTVQSGTNIDAPKIGVYTRGALKVDNDGTKFYSVFAPVKSSGTVWLDYIVSSNSVINYYTQISVDNRIIYDGKSIQSGIFEDYVKGEVRQTVTEGETQRQWSSIFVPTYSEQATTTVTGGTAQPFTLVAAVDFGKPGVYEFKIVRRSPDSTDQRDVSDTQLTLIKSFQDGEIFRLDRRHTMLEMRILANDRISGVVSNLSAICTGVLRVFDGTNWNLKPSRNPAWIAYDILTGTANAYPLRDAQMDLASFYSLAKICDEVVTSNVNGVEEVGPRFQVDIIVDYETTVHQLVESVLSSARATLIITQSGKYGVLIDKEQSIPRQLFTPANSWGFSGNRSYSDRPHALRVGYVEPKLNWQGNEVIVYDDGYDKTNATRFEELPAFGITDSAAAWRYGRYMLAQGLQRTEQFMISVDVENLAVQRGDLVRIAHDVPKIGGIGARVARVDGNVVVMSEDVGVELSHYTVRLSDGIVRSGVVTANGQDGDTYTLDDASGIGPDDLIVFGNTERVTQEYLVQEITPAPDLAAELTLVRYVPGIYTADVGLIPPWDAGITDSVINSTDLRIDTLIGSAELTYVIRQPVSRILLDFTVLGRAYAYARVYWVRPNFGDTYIGETSTLDFIDRVSTLEDANLGPRRYYVVPFNSAGLEGEGAFVTVQVEPDRMPPPAPYGFSVNIQHESAELFWRASEAPDISFYMLRYSPETFGATWNASQFLAQVDWQTTSTSAGARTGTYMIRAYDTSGNHSVEAFQYTTVAHLPDINYVEEVNDQPEGWVGYHYLTEPRGGVLIAQGLATDVVPVSYYNCRELVDLGEPYEARVASKIRAYGEHAEDIISTWALLSEVDVMARAESDEWDAWVEIRTSDTQYFISQWPTMAEIDPIATATEDLWTPWRVVQVGDFTGQLFQFRLQLRSFQKNVRPVVTDGLIEVDMPDRTDYDNDIPIPSQGRTIFFDPAFRVTPSTAVTIDGNTQPVVAYVTSKDRYSFDVQLINVQTGLPAPGKIDWQAEGYGRRALASI